MKRFFILLFCSFIPILVFSQNEQQIRNQYEQYIQYEEQYIARCESEIRSTTNLWRQGVIPDEQYNDLISTWEREKEKARDKIDYYRNKMQAEINRARQQEQERKQKQQAQAAQQRAQQQRAAQAQQARTRQAQRSRQEQQRQAQRARELEAKRAAERAERERRRQEEERARQIKYQNDYNSSIQRTNQYYSQKKSDAQWMASSDAIYSMRNTIDQNRLEKSIEDVVIQQSNAQVNNSSGINRLKNRQQERIKNSSTPIKSEDTFFDLASLFTLSSLSSDSDANVDQWPYKSRIPITQTRQEPAFIEDDSYYNSIPSVPLNFDNNEYDPWKDIEKDPSLTKERLALIRGTLTIANGGELPGFVETRDDGRLVFGDDNNVFVVSADRSWFEYVKLSEKNYQETNIIKRFNEGESIVSYDAQLNAPEGVKVSPVTQDVSLPGGINVSSAKGEVSHSKTVDEKSTKEKKDLLDFSESEKTEVGVTGSLKTTLVDNNSKLTRGWGYIMFNRVMVGREYEVTAGGKIDAKVAGELGKTKNNNVNASIGASASIDALSYEERVFVNTLSKVGNGYKTKTTGGALKLSAGLFARYKVSKKEIEAGVGNISLKGSFISKEFINP